MPPLTLAGAVGGCLRGWLRLWEVTHEGAGAPVKLIWEVPTETAEVEAPFEFVDVPLPW